ncbi:MAG: triose-phosphate isomerase [Candidatus Tectomicrobia bacterium]|uniref:Triosephosphate isomerase n=1 Tax=Tectimicrobiota bacterium TaxID=2528274 RepID=A0A938B142_UNCTE|nr:triose-phosphate isomerase [Candidatus Tectomicrobia bacterium]
MRQPIIAANWKLHKTIAEAQQFVTELAQHCANPAPLEVVIAAPFTALAALRTPLQATTFCLAAQDVFWENSGAYTGEISAPMLVDVGCRYVIIGHSERRQYFAETDETVSKKVTAALQAGLRAIVCIGESLAQRQAGDTVAVLEQQVLHGLAACQPEAMAHIVLAYEPLWAIGTGVTATPQQAQEVHAALRALLARQWGTATAETVRIQYGGSVRPENIAALLVEPDIDGALVGGASLDAQSFAQLLMYGRM